MFPSAIYVLLLLSIFIHNYPIETRTENENENRFYFHFSKKKVSMRNEKKEHFYNSSNLAAVEAHHLEQREKKLKLLTEAFNEIFPFRVFGAYQFTSNWVGKRRRTKKRKIQTFHQFFFYFLVYYLDSLNEFHRFEKHKTHTEMCKSFLQNFFHFNFSHFSTLDSNKSLFSSFFHTFYSIFYIDSRDEKCFLLLKCDNYIKTFYVFT